MHRRFALFSALALLTALLAVPCPVRAQDAAQNAPHVVSPSDLQQATTDSERTRLQNQRTLQQFFSSPQARQALQKAHMDPQKVDQAVNGLSDAEMAQLAVRARQAQSDFAGGLIGDHALLIILVALAAVILIVVVA